METDLNSFGRIGILMGGSSSEREISLKSGKAVYESLKTKAQDVVTIDIQNDDWAGNSRLIQKTHRIDIAFIALHGCFGEDGQIQAMLEQMNIPYTGSGPAASRLAMDKIISRRIFQEGGLPVPNYIVVSREHKGSSMPEMTQHLFPPYVVKPATQGSSIGLSIVDRQKELARAIEHAAGFDQRVVIEEYIGGREITVGILGESALPIVEIIPQNKFYDYEAKYKSGKSNYVVPAILPDQITTQAKRIAQAAHRLLGCSGFSRVDMRLSHDNIPFVLEVNSIPGLTSNSLLPKAAKAAGLDFTQLCICILRLAVQRQPKTNTATATSLSRMEENKAAK
jgi:D-alanine--D-alanine ligase